MGVGCGVRKEASSGRGRRRWGASRLGSISPRRGAGVARATGSLTGGGVLRRRGAAARPRESATSRTEAFALGGSPCSARAEGLRTAEVRGEEALRGASARFGSSGAGRCAVLRRRAVAAAPRAGAARRDRGARARTPTFCLARKIRAAPITNTATVASNMAGNRLTSGYATFNANSLRPLVLPEARIS